MLGLLRKKAKSWIIQLLLGAIIIVFVFWGVGSFRERKMGEIAMVNGESITFNEYTDAYNNFLDQLRQRFGKNLNDDMIKMLQVKKETLNRLIDRKLLKTEAGKLKLRVTDDEVSDGILKIEAFQNSGIFDNRLYNRVLNHIRLTPEEFETSQRESLLIEKLNSFISGSVKVSEDEAKEWFTWSNVAVNIDFVIFDPGTYKNIDPAAENIEAYFESHKEAYKTEPKIKVRYLYFDPETYKAKVTIPEKNIKDYYDSRQDEFITPKTVEARHILIKVDNKADPDVIEEKRKKALDIQKMAKEGKDFAELAKKYSEGPSARNGGSLGAFKKESMVKPFADQAFSMEPGEISSLVLTRFGWHIIKVEKVNEESIKSFKDAENFIRKKLVKERAVNMAYDEAEAVYNISFEGEDLIKAAGEHSLTLKTTDFFSSKGPEKNILKPRDFASFSFSLPEMEVSEVQDFGDGYYILQVVDKISEKIPEFDIVKDSVRLDLIKVKQDETAYKDAEEFRASVINGNPFDAESKKFDLTIVSSGFFKRNDPLPKSGLEREVAEVSFKLSSKNRFPGNIIKGRKGYYAVQFKERKDPDPEGFEKEKEAILKKLIGLKKRSTFNAWLTELRNRSEITINDDFL